MPEQVDRKNSTMHNKKRELSFVENIELQLKAGDTIENLEKSTKAHIEAAEKELQRLKDGKAASDVIFVATKRLEKWIAYGKAVKSYKETLSIESQLQEQVTKTKKCYEETIQLGEEIINYVNQIEIENLGDIPAKKKFLDEKIGKFEKHLQIQLDLNKKTISLLGELRELKPNYDVYEQYRGLIPSFEGKTVDYVKAKYKETKLKIKALEEKKAKADFLNDKRKFEDLIKSLENTIDKVLPYMLSNPKKMELIKEEVAKELGTEYKPKVDPEGPEIPGGTPTGETGGTDDDPTKKGQTGQGGQTGNTGNGDSGYVPPVTGKDSPKFKEAKAEYINIVEAINKLIDKLNDFNFNQSQYAFNPELNYDKMISTEKEVLKINIQISRYKDMLTELEYKKYVDEHIMLNLDPEMKDIKPKEMDYNSDLEEFMQLHNSVIAGCYARLHEIAAIPNYKDNAELVAESKKLLEVIDVQHMVINRRLITERHKNKDFDLISFMKAHRVDPKQVQKGTDVKPAQPAVQPGKGENPGKGDKGGEKPGNNQPPKKDEDAIVKDIERQIVEFQKELLTLYIARYLLELKLASIAQIDSELETIETNIKKLEKAIRQVIDQSGLSDEKRNALHERVDGAKMQTSTEVDNQFQAYTNQHNLRRDFVKEVKLLMLYSEQLIKLSEVSIDSEEYKTKIEAYYQKIEELKVKFAKYDVKFAVDSVTSKTKITVGEKSGLNMSVITQEQKPTAEIISLSVMSLEKEKELSKQKSVKISKTKLDFGGKVQNVDRRNAIVGTLPKVRITLLKNSIRVQYTKQMLEDLKGLRVRLEVAAAAENKNDIQVTKAVDTKDGKKEYRHIKNPTKLTSAELIYRDMDTNEELASYDILQNEEIQEVLEERRKMSR